MGCCDATAKGRRVYRNPGDLSARIDLYLERFRSRIGNVELPMIADSYEMTLDLQCLGIE